MTAAKTAASKIRPNLQETPHVHDQEQVNAEQFAENMAKIIERTQELLSLYLVSQPVNTQEPPMAMQESWHIGSAFMQMYEKMLADPMKCWDMQLAYWKDYNALWHNAARRFAGETLPPEPANKDKRFKDATWQENAGFDFIKQAYLLTSDYLQRSVSDVEGLDEHTRRKLEFYTRQFVDALAPTNFLMTNPEALRKTLETGGKNLVDGLENMLEDLKRGKGKQLRISMTDESAFEVGKNLATTKGEVIFQNDLMQLIQYTPQTESVHKTPLLIIPAWINKYYILDLQPENSLVKWAVEQGYTVFMISWVNPDEQLSNKTFEDYLNEGPLAALDAIEQATGEKSITAMGYCLGGTLLTCTRAYLHSKKQQDRIKSATFLTTMTDFKEAGELGIFVDEEQLQLLEHKMQKQGYLEGREMAQTFNMLRANDLIWSFVVNNYLLGKDPFPFDLLFWNADSTRMPAVMHSYYLRNMYQQNKLIQNGGLTLNGVAIDLRTIETPVYMLSTREDHIAPWKSTYTATQLFKGSIRFVLAASGHIAGVVNPPVKNKYCYWAEDKKQPLYPTSPDAWFKLTREHAGSWWGDWDKWQAPFTGGKIPARQISSGKLKPIESAPGTYVKVNAR